jgi:predicted nucleotidyltransferase
MPDGPVPRHGLTARQVETLRRVLAPFADRVESAALFGSRATGTARPESDIDLVVHGPVTDRDVGRMQVEFEESDLPMTVDVVAYDRIAHPPLRAHIDEVAVTLFRRADLAG